MDIQDEKHRSRPEEENNPSEGNNNSQENEQEQNSPKMRQDLGANEECNPRNDDYNSSLTPEIISEKIKNVLRLTSLPLVEEGTPESLLYQTWHTKSQDSFMNLPLSDDFFSVEHILRRERELNSPKSHLLQNLIDLAEAAVPSKKPIQKPLEKQNTTPKVDLASDDYQAELQRAETPPSDNFGNFLSATFSPSYYLPLIPGRSISNHMAQFDLNSSYYGTPSVTPTPLLPPGNLQSDLQSVKPSSSNEPCRYCTAAYKFPQNHDKKECPKLACMKPCKVCHASGHQNHTLMHCPLKEKVVLKLKRNKRNDGTKDNKND